MAKKTKPKRVERYDGWRNFMTGMGIKGRDKREATSVEWELLTEPEAESLYSGSDVARKIVDEIVDDAFREGYQLKADEITPTLTKSFEDEDARLQINKKLHEASRYARLYGGGAIIAIPNDVTKLAQPFVPEQVVEIRSLLVLTRWELPRGPIEYDIRSSNFMMPKSYRICPRGGAGETQGFDQMNEEVHHSRVLRFDGDFLPRVTFLKNNHWHDSVLNKCRVPIRDYTAALSSVSATLDDFSVGVMKIQNLARMMAEDRDDLIMKRMEINSMSKSVAKMLVLDAEKEEYAYQDRQLSGVADCVRLVSGRLVVSSDMPHTKILGESPEGSQATGNSTTKDWYDNVHSWQKNYLNEKVLKLWSWVLAAKKSPTRGQVPKGLKTAYTPLWQDSQGDQSKARLSDAQADALRISGGVLKPAEVANSRFGTGTYSAEIKLESGDRSKILPPMKGLPPGAGDPSKAGQDPDKKPVPPPSKGKRKVPENT